MKTDVAGGRNPRDIKVQLAQELVARFRQGALPEDMPECEVNNGGLPLSIVQALKQSGLTGSTSESLRMIDQGAG